MFATLMATLGDRGLRFREIRLAHVSFQKVSELFKLILKIFTGLWKDYPAEVVLSLLCGPLSHSPARYG